MSFKVEYLNKFDFFFKMNLGSESGDQADFFLKKKLEEINLM